MSLFIVSLTNMQNAKARDVSNMNALQFDRAVKSCQFEISQPNNEWLVANSKNEWLIANTEHYCNCVMLEVLKYEDEEILNWSINQRNEITLPIAEQCITEVMKTESKIIQID